MASKDTGASRHIVFLDRETLPEQVTVRPPAFAHTIEEYPRTKPEDVVARAGDAEIIITNKVPLRAETLAALPKLKMIAVAATGTDIIDLKACAERGITVSNIREYAIATVPEHTMGLILSLSRSIRPYHLSVAAGRWKEADQFCYFDYPIFDLKGKVLGIIGDGVLGKSVAKLAEAFGMEVRYSTYKGVDGMGPLYTPFERILSESDVITMHCPLMDSTRNLLGPAEFDQMKKRPLVINTARGGLVDEQALVDALKAGKIAGAAFDVVTTEPVPDGHPFLDVMDMPNFILTPHVAWASIEAIQGLADQMVDNIDAYVAGSPRNVVGG
ncbi:MAG: D-2-hydroxyacid dehydrogenase [Rhodospirillales bacterium]|nr:D-2-hydroxyacid dehydrogenase [Rhodospirillales bacterium]MBO6788415.1 D-2-hydroxyacid dehydrogenase [Rhodospirillales bacterium]